jgi:hypothetical protein
MGTLALELLSLVLALLGTGTTDTLRHSYAGLYSHLFHQFLLPPVFGLSSRRIAC